VVYDRSDHLIWRSSGHRILGVALERERSTTREFAQMFDRSRGFLFDRERIVFLGRKA
jgi:hypothetical protein